MKKLVGIFCDVLVKVESYIFPTNFVILDCEVDFEVSIRLGMLFLTARWALNYAETGIIKFRLNNKQVTFNVC